MRLDAGAKMVTKQGRDDREARRRKTANLSIVDALTTDDGGNGEPAPVAEEDKVNPSQYHEHCTICNVEFDLTPDGTPRVLDCGHRFCTKCLRLLLKTAEDGSGGDKILLCPRNYVATDKNWYSKNNAAKWTGNGRAGLVLQTEIVGDRSGLLEAKKKLEHAKEHVEAERRRQQSVRDNQEMLSETNSEFIGETESDFAKSLQDLEKLVAEAEQDCEIMKEATVVQPMKECKKGKNEGQTVVKGGDVEDLSRHLSEIETAKADVIQLVELAQSVVRVGPPGPLNPALSGEIIFRLSNQVCSCTHIVVYAYHCWRQPVEYCRQSNSITACMGAVQFLYCVFFIIMALYPVISQTIFQSFLCQVRYAKFALFMCADTSS